jgi:hypothetical protein
MAPGATDQAHPLLSTSLAAATQIGQADLLFSA